MKYYNSLYQNYDEKNQIDFFVIFLNVFKCRHCQCVFSFNNQLHDHVRRKTCLQQFIKSIFLKQFFVELTTKMKIFFSFANRKTFTKIFVVESFNIEITKKSKFFIKLFIIYFFVDFKSNIDTKYAYRKWNYVKTTIFFFENVKSKMCCLNIDVDVNLINRKFLKTQIFDIQIKLMIIFFVRELNINCHFTTKYVIVFIYFIDKNCYMQMSRF